MKNENLINIYHNKNKNNKESLNNYINIYESFDINEFICFNTRYIRKCHLTYPTFDFIDTKIYNLIK